MARNDLAWDSSRSTRDGIAAATSAIVFWPDTSMLRTAAVPQSHRTEKNAFLKPALADRSSLNPAIGLIPRSAGNVSLISAWICLSDGKSCASWRLRSSVVDMFLGSLAVLGTGSVVGGTGFEPVTSAMSTQRSKPLS